MKYIIYVLIAVSFIACKNKQEQAAQKAIDRYIVFVDSVNQARHENRVRRWQFIVQEHERKKNDAEAALVVLKGKAYGKERRRVNKGYSKYQGVKVLVESHQ